jgi:hypothetical protein
MVRYERVEEPMSEEAEERYRFTLETTVGEVLFVMPGAEEVFERHGCAPTIECTEEHHSEYILGDLELVCHIDDSMTLVADLNALLDAEEAALAPAAQAA